MTDVAWGSRNTDRDLLSVVIVTYNEAERIRDCIESVLAACRSIGPFEVILVDSNSTDRTVEYAREYPITVLRIPSDDLTTPGAGRYVGTRAASGAEILFVDGDMTISGSWLRRARETLRGERVAAVDGHLNHPAASDGIREVDSVRGVTLYDADALRSVGGFDPWLRSLEDIHLGFLLTEAGYRLLRRSDVAATHPTKTTIREPMRRWRQGYTVGPGQVLRRSIRAPRRFLKYCRRFRYHFGTLAWILVGAWIAVGVGPIGLLGWCLVSFVAFAAVVSKRGVVGAIEFFTGKLLGIVGIAIGLREPPRSRSAFPLETIEVVADDPGENTHVGPPRSSGWGVS